MRKPARTARGGTFRRLLRHPSGAIGLILTTIFLLLAVFGTWLAPFDFAKADYLNATAGMNVKNWLGTDEFGRDILSRLLNGAKYSIGIGVSATLIGAIVGGIWGLLTAYIGGAFDAVSMRIVDVLLAFPGMLLAIGLITLMGSGVTPLLIAMSIFGLPLFARLARGSALSAKEGLFIEAARGLGSGHLRIIFLHLLPSIISPILVYATLRTGTTLLVASGLSFLGLGLRPPTPEWGAMLSEAQLYLSVHPIMAFAPGIFITLAVLGFNLLGDGLRDVLDPTLKNV